MMGRRIPAPLPVWEQTTYWLVFISGAIYGIYNLFLTSWETRHRLLYTIESTGIMNRFSDTKDVASLDWYMYETHLCWVLPPLLLLHVAVSLALQYLNVAPKRKVFVYTLLGVACILYLLSWRFLLLMSLIPLLFYLVSAVNSLLLVWAFFFAAIYAFKAYAYSMTELLMIESSLHKFEAAYFLAAVFFRCLYFAIEKVWSTKQQEFASSQQQETSPLSVVPQAVLHSKNTAETSRLSSSSSSSSSRERKSAFVTNSSSHTSYISTNKNDSSSVTKRQSAAAKGEKHLYDWPVMTEVPGVIELYFYVFYVPGILGGPALDFKTFIQQALTPVPLTRQRLLASVWKMLRIIFWVCFNYVMLHFLYFPAVSQDGDLLRGVNKWTLASVAYLTGQFMTNKYVVIYGFMAEVSRFDGLDLPQAPACISYIYMYSDLWKSFDRGLYSCLKRYVYIPLGGSRKGWLRGELSSFMTFFLLGFWHGGTRNYFLWAVLNFIEVTLEGLGAFLETNPFIQKHITSQLSPSWDRRMRALLAYPLLLLGTTSNQFFMAGHDLGYQYATRICLQVDSFFTLGVIAYSAIQVSKHLERLGHTKFG